ncbi:unnamed protein product [Bemisia tabaci]|uniref:Nuclear pore complex protein Nup98-Nup96 n=1 Tax=Bemisia tabaci TaxID=7038 RepID=A0A9P0F2D6_BEMTA|nr:unnamed protein product [Bemisia tabaci]
MFGQSTPFGAASTSNTGFGQSTFGKPAGFAAPVFGGGNTSLFNPTPAQPQTGGLFGSSTTTPAFGQPQTTQTPFGQTSGFGSIFGQQQNATTSGTSGTLFGAQQNPATSSAGGTFFASSNTSAFGQTKPFSFGTSTGLFGQTQQPAQQQTSLFGQPAAQTSSLFGASASATNIVGTPIKFNPVTGSDSMVKNGVTTPINTRHYCITCMKEYEGKSLEELRLEDYMVIKKGGQQPQGTTPGLFGSTAAPTLFGGATTSTSTGTGIFGSTENKPLFGGTTSAIGTFGSTSGGTLFSSNTGTTDLFGKNQTAPAFGAPAATQSTGFGFSAPTTSNMFGTNTAQVRPFGATTQAPTLFGSTPQQSSLGFGTSTSGFGGFGTQNQGGLFAQNKPAFGLGATTTAGFGFGSNTATNTSAFGAKLGTAFGSTPASTGSTFGSTMFNTTATSQPTSGLFGSTLKPTATFSFGQTATTNTSLGGGLNLGSNMFGNNAAKPGGLFGSTTNTGGTLFGSNTFGGGLGSGFGTGTNTGLGSSLSFGGNTLGSTATNQTQNTTVNGNVNQQILALASMPFGDTPLFKNLLPVTGKADTLLKSVPKSKSMFSEKDYKVSPRQSPGIKVRPVNRSDFSKKSLFDGLEDIKDQQGSLLTKSNPKALVLPAKDFSSPNKKANDDEVTIQLEPPTIISKFAKSTSAASDTSVSNIKKSMISCAIQTPSRTEDFSSRNGESNSNDSPSTKSGSKSSSSPVMNNTMTLLLPQKNTAALDGSPSPPVVDSSNHDVSNESENRRSLDETSASNSSKNNESDGSISAPHPTGIILHRVGYYTIPSLEELTPLVDGDGRCIVENFTIGRRNYGNIFYPDSFDVSGLDIDSIVHIRHKEVVVYPDESIKPSVGEGLNRKAQITLDRVWPTDKSSHQPISDPVRLVQLDYEGKLRKACAKLKTRFVEYRPQTGSWVFKVDHFSKYGLSDSDEEEDQVADVKKLKMIGGVHPLSALEQARRTSINVHLKKQMQMPSHYNPFEPNEDQHMLDENDSLLLKNNYHIDDVVSALSQEKVHKSPTSELARNLGTSSHKVQLMKASFYLNQDENDDAYSIDSDYMDFTNMPTSRAHDLVEMDTSQREMARLTAKTFPVFRTQFVQQPILPAATSMSVGAGDEELASRAKVTTSTKLFMSQPIVAAPQRSHLNHPNSVLPFHLSSVARIKAKCISDMSLFMGRSFRVGWGKELNLVHLTTDKLADSFEKHNDLQQLGDLLAGRTKSDFTKTIVQQLKIISPSASQTFKDLIQSHMDVRLKFSKQDVQDDCPVFSPVAGIEALHAHSLIADQQSENYTDTRYAASIWQLCVALWGNLPDLAAKDDERDHASLMARRHAFSEWLQSVVHASVKKDTVNEQQVSSVFHLLTGKKILEACEMAISQGDYNLSLLISQVGSNNAVRVLASKQLMQWRDTEADKLIDENRIKLTMCTAGVPLFESSFGVINVCQNLDWKRALGIHFWYLGSPADSITTALQAYEKACSGEENYAEKPVPYYSDGELDYDIVRGKEFSDVCFHLLKLYSQRSHPLESLLNPATYTADPLDYSLSWLLLETLESLGYRHISELSAAHIHVSFAMQLEGHGLWHWAVFVLLHLKNVQRRRQAVLDIIGKHVTLSEDGKTTLNKTEVFINETLGVPIEWIYDAKATLALSFHRYNEAAWYFIKSSQWSRSHQIIMQHLAADAIINEKYDNLEALLSQCATNSTNISGWHHFGSVISDYLTCVREVNHLIAAQDSSVAYQLEKLQPQISSICSRVQHLPTFSAKDRLMQAEIAKRIAHIVRSILMLQTGDIGASSHILASLIAQLPLPEDYEQQEIQQIIAPLIDNFASL